MKVNTIRNVGPTGIDIVFQRFGNSTSPPVILIMGGGAQMISWPDGFCNELVNHGLQIIRFDNRDSGLSTHLTNAPVPDLSAAMSGDFTTVYYTLSDMAADTIGLVDALGFDKVHVVGASLGGMIAQTIAIEYPSRILSLTSIMSTTGDRTVGQTDFSALAHIGSPPNDDRQGYIDWRIRVLKAINGPGYPFDEVTAAETAGLSWDRDHDPLGMLRQSVAVLKSGDRTERLKKLHIPALVMHGDADKMIDISGGRATAAAIPGAQLQIFAGLGHGFPKPLWPEMARLISQLVFRAEVTN